MARTDPAGDRPVVAMMVANNVKSDGRVQKCASAVASFGYDVHLFGISPDDEVQVGRVGRAELRLVPVSWVLRHAEPPTPLRERVRHRASAWLGVDDEAVYETKWRRIKLEQREIESARGRAENNGEPQLGRSLRRGRLSVQSRLIDMTHRLAHGATVEDEPGWRTNLPEMHDYELAFSDELMRVKPDVIHAHDVHLLGVAVRTAERMRARGANPKVIYDSHEFVPGVASNHPWKTALLAEMELEYIGRVDRIVTVSPLLAEWLERDHHPTNPVTVVMNTPVAAWDEQTDEVPSLRDLAGVPTGAPMVVYSGGYSKFRGVHTLVDAMTHLPGCHLVMVAPDGHRYVEQLCSRGEEKGVGERIHVAPFVPPHQVSRYLAEADVGVHPMLHAPNHEVALPNKYFEYLHAGLPMVVSDVELMSRQARLDGVGEVFVAEDDVDLAGAISRVLADRGRYTSNITPELLHEYSWERQAEHLRTLYADIGLAIPPTDGAIETSVRVEGIEYPEPEQPEVVEPRLLIGPDQLDGQVPAMACALSRYTSIAARTAGFIDDQTTGPRSLDVAMPRHRWHDEPWQRVHVDQITSNHSHVILTGATSLVGPIYGGLLGDEIAMFNAKGIATALILDGASVRDPHLHRELEPDSPFRHAPPSIVEAADIRSRHARRIAERSNGFVFVATVDLLDEIRGAAWLPMVIEITDTPASIVETISSVPLVVHAPSDPFLAGSTHVDRIGARLAEEGLIEYRGAHGIDASERHEMLAGADIVLDDFATGHHGLVALEGLALGRIVVANQSHRVRARMPEEVPLVSSSITRLEETLRSIVADPGEALHQAALGPSYIRRYHDGRLTAAQLERWARRGRVLSIEELAHRAGAATKRVPDLPGLGLTSASVSFGYATGTEVHRTIAAGSSYEQDVMATLLACLTGTESALFIDVGANIGYFPIVVRKLLGERINCVAYEPTPELAAMIRRGCTHNGVDVDIREAAVGAESGTATFYLSARSDASNSLNSEFRTHRGKIDVAVTTLDEDLLPSLQTQLPARPMLLIDTETTEPDVLRGATELIQRHRPGIICEVLAGRTEQQIQQFVETSDYSAYALTDDGPERREHVVGDPTYTHRDWLLWPSESAPPIESIRRTLADLLNGAYRFSERS